MTENRETLVKFGDTYFWDVFAIITTGFILFTEIDYFTQIEKFHWIAYFFLFYALGLVGDGLLGLLLPRKLSKCIFKNSYEKKEAILKEKVKKYKDFKDDDLENSELIIRIRNYLEIHHTPHRYLSFFSKYRFYYNLSVISLINTFFLWIVYFFPNHFEHHFSCSTTSMLSILSLFLWVCFLSISNKFWFYSCQELYLKFLLSRER